MYGSPPPKDLSVAVIDTFGPERLRFQAAANEYMSDDVRTELLVYEVPTPKQLELTDCGSPMQTHDTVSAFLMRDAAEAACIYISVMYCDCCQVCDKRSEDFTHARRYHIHVDVEMTISRHH